MSGEQGNIQSVDTGSKRVKVATVDTSEDFKEITFSFSDGQQLQFRTDQLSPEIQSHGLAHGLIQKLRDSYAGVKGNASEAFTNAKEVLDNLMAGEWRVAAGEGGVGTGGAMYIEAISRIKGISLEDARARVSKQTDEWKKLVQKDPAVVTMVATIKLERAQAAVEAAKAGGTSGAGGVSLDDLFAAA